MHAAELGGSVDGMLAEVVLMPATGVVPVPRGWSAQWASTLPCAALTAWNALNEGQPLRPGQTVLLLGTGGVSVFGLQFARMMGARTIITSSSDAKLERMKALGADLCINYQARPDWERDVIDATDGEGADLILEVGGGNTLEKSMRCVATGGQIAYIGMVAGDAAIDPRPLIGRAASLRGIYVGNRRMFREMVMAIDQNGLEPVIDRVFPFHQAPEAYRHLQAKDHVGKVVIAD
jgi:NADPH:quinone reductase-like Zn-dependent oxidoreductase